MDEQMKNARYIKSFTKLSLIGDATEFTKRHRIDKRYYDLTKNDMIQLLTDTVAESVMLDVHCVRFETQIHPVIFAHRFDKPTFITFQPTSIEEKTVPDSVDCLDRLDSSYPTLTGTVRVFESNDVDKCKVDLYEIKNTITNVVAKYRPDLGYVCEYVQDSSEYGTVYLSVLLKPCMGFALYRQG